MRYLAALLLFAAAAVLFLLWRNPARRAEYVLSRVLGAEKSFVTIERYGADEGFAFGDSAYAFEITAHTNLAFFSKGPSSIFRDDLQFANDNIEGLLNQQLSTDGALQLFRSSVPNDGGSWSVYALTSTNENRIYLLVLTM